MCVVYTICAFVCLIVCLFIWLLLCHRKGKKANDNRKLVLLFHSISWSVLQNTMIDTIYFASQSIACLLFIYTVIYNIYCSILKQQNFMLWNQFDIWFLSGPNSNNHQLTFFCSPYCNVDTQIVSLSNSVCYSNFYSVFLWQRVAIRKTNQRVIRRSRWSLTETVKVT
jgi:hypothetical protein